MEEEWFKPKKYPHIGLPITKQDWQWISTYVKNAENIKSHSFLPLIHRSLVQRKFRANQEMPLRNPKGKRRRKVGKPKVRDIFYASHLDSLIYSYYNHILAEKYENYVSKCDFNEAVVAYRKIPVNAHTNSNKCNIDFAKSAFQFILEKYPSPVSVIIADVTGFFDNLDHKEIKKQWKKILCAENLPKDHYNIFKSLTTLRYVEEDQLFKEYQNKIIVEKGTPNNSKKKQQKQISIKSLFYLKEKRALAYCTKEDFLENSLKLVISKNKTKGIPQGSPISATLANIYMLDFDDELNKKIQEIGGFYQRYSDDLIIVCNQEYETFILSFVRRLISDQVKLDIHPDKTQVYRFEKNKTTYSGCQIDEFSKLKNPNKSLEYLGFSFDGEKVLIKTAGFSKFHRSMKKSFKKSTSLAIHSKNPEKKLFKSRLYKRFTHRGAKRKLIYRPTIQDPSIYLPTKKQDWGNYISYINKADETMKSLNGSNFIKKQGRKLWYRFHILLKASEKKVNAEINKH